MQLVEDFSFQKFDDKIQARSQKFAMGAVLGGASSARKFFHFFAKIT